MSQKREDRPTPEEVLKAIEQILARKTGSARANIAAAIFLRDIPE